MAETPKPDSVKAELGDIAEAVKESILVVHAKDGAIPCSSLAEAKILSILVKLEQKLEQK